MNLLRMEAEAEFLSFLPSSERQRIRDSWYRPAGVSKIVDVLDPMYASAETRIAYADSAQAKDEFVKRLVTTVLPSAVVGVLEPLQWTDIAISGDDPASRFERAARSVVATAAPFARTFPDATLVRIRTGRADDAVYTIVRNKAHLNIDFMFLESEERVPEEDTLHVLRGIVASRPNLFLTVDADAVERFVTDLMALRADDGSFARFLDRYGVRRRDAGFWAASDFFYTRFTQMDPLTAGVLDLSRYSND
jgi:Fatty acid cis/trans isomerase (CTI)